MVAGGCRREAKVQKSNIYGIVVVSFSGSAQRTSKLG